MKSPRAPSRIHVNTDAIRRNVSALRDEMAPARLVVVVKTNAYGHGYSTVVPAAAAGGADAFAVFSAREAAHVLRHAPEGCTVQVMGHQDPADLPWLAAHGVEVWANDPDDVADLLSMDAPAHPIGVHVEVETGMYRTGLDPDAAVDTARRLADTDHTRLVGLCTHLAGAEEAKNDDRVGAQLEIFERTRQALADHGLTPLCHVASSSAALRWPEHRYDMVRLGIASYGLWPTPEVQRHARDHGSRLHLRPALSWHTQVMACKDVPAGSCVGYGDAFCTAQQVRIGIVPVGYGDGFTRLLSMQGHVLVRGRCCPIVGQVNMNMIMVLLDDPSVGPGEPVVLIGRQGDERIGVRSFAEWNEAVNYELMARLAWEVPRVAVDAPE